MGGAGGIGGMAGGSPIGRSGGSGLRMQQSAESAYRRRTVPVYRGNGHRPLELQISFMLTSQAEDLSKMDSGLLDPLTPGEILKLYEDDRHSIVMAARVIGDPDELNGTAGFVHYRLADNSRRGVCGISIQRIVVDKAFRRMGIGRAMFNFVRQKLDVKRRYLSVSCREDDWAALGFFSAMGGGEARLIRQNCGVDLVGWIFEK